jgi:hypothetical protein
MKLTPDQLDLISKEIIKGGIKYQDLYEELLDHYILAIEDRLTQGHTFGEAFGEVHTDFVNYKRPARTWDHYGVWETSFGGQTEFGLGKLQAEYIESLSKEISKRHWQIMREYFRWPTIITTLLVGLLTFQFAYLVPLKIALIFFGFLSFAPLLFLLPDTFLHSIDYFKKKRKFINSLKWSAISSRATFALSLFNCYIFIPRVLEIELKTFSPQIQATIVATLTCFYLAYSLSFYQLYRERFKVKMA